MGKTSLLKQKISIKWQIFLGSMIVALIPSAVLFFFYLTTMSSFYRREIQSAQINELNTISDHLETIFDQVEKLLDSTTGMIVISKPFDDYDAKTSFEKLQVRRSVENELVNRILTYTDVENIYIETFDGEVFTPHSSEINRDLYKKYTGVLDRDQKGTETLVAFHQAYYIGQGKNIISFKRYLNQYTPGRKAGLIQADVSLEVLKAAASIERLSGEDYVLMLDSDKNIIYSPNEKDIGKNIREIAEFPVSYQELFAAHVIRSGGTTVYYSPLSKYGWSVIQVNNDLAFRDAMAAARKTWQIVTAISLFAAFGAGFIISINIDDSILTIIHSMQEASKGNFQLSTENLGSREFSALTDSFNRMIKKIDNLMKENVQKEHEKTVLELSALNSKINSHFLYNTLNLIKLLAIKNKQPDIAQIIVALAGILEYSYKDTDTLVPLYSELEFVKKYHFIQTRRLGKNIRLDYDVDELAGDAKVPKMSIQPIVENSIIHAFPNNNSENMISITGKVKPSEQRVDLIIEDNGEGFDFQGMDNLTGVGIKNVWDRLNIFYGKKYQFSIESKQGKGTRTAVSIPLMKS